MTADHRASRLSSSAAVCRIFDGHQRPLRAATQPLPDVLDDGQVLVAIELATICGSDLHTLAGQRQERTPCILGHEAVGRVVATGQGRGNLHVGDRITWSIADSCGICPFCVEYDLPEKCRSLFKYGHAPLSDGCGLNGCYASHIVLRRGTHIVSVPDALEDRIAAPINCALATVINAIATIPDSAGTVVIQGGGMLGIYACAALHERGVANIFCVDINERRMAQVARFGGTAVDGRPERCIESRRQIEDAAPDGVDAVLEVAGVSTLVPEGIRLLRPGGFYGFVGMVHPESRLDITGEQIIRKCLTIRGVHNYSSRHLDAAVALLERTVEKYPYEELVSPPFVLADLDMAVQAAKEQTHFRVAVKP